MSNKILELSMRELKRILNGDIIIKEGDIIAIDKDNPREVEISIRKDAVIKKNQNKKKR